MIRVPFRLRRHKEAEPATALLVPSHAATALLRLCHRLKLDPLPPVYHVTDGFLVQLPRPLLERVPGVFHLRRLANHLLLPVDAELIPALLSDEAAALVKQRGLVFLPGDRVLEYAPEQPLPLSALVSAPAVERPGWQPLPAGTPLADHISEFRLDLPEQEPDDLLQAGGGDIGTEDPRPEAVGMPRKLLGSASLRLGQLLVQMGRLLKLRGLARAGARLMGRGLNLAPRLSERLMGLQEAALRRVLRDFREGRIEQALRRAVPMSDDLPRGSRPGRGASLPWNNLFYSLRNILAGSNSPASIWFGSNDIWQDLRAEYRKLADDAVRRGDYRRAAFIYGKLLRDYRSAANVLAEGGLHEDAAVLYLVKLGDPLAAAGQYTKAGRIDKALAIYRQRGEHELAGDLLRQAGEEEQAIEEYRLAAQQLVAQGDGYLKAGEMLLNRAKLPDLALEYFQAGWRRQQSPNAVRCAIRLAQLYTDREQVDALLQLVGEAERHLRPAGNDAPASDFFNEVAQLGDRPALARVRDDLRDRALLGIAGKVRQQAELRGGIPGLASSHFFPPSVWPADVVQDADFAARPPAGLNDQPGNRVHLTTTVIQGRIPVIRAVCQAPQSGHLFLGFESGEVVRFDPATGEVLPVTESGHAVIGLAAHTDADYVVILRQDPAEQLQLTSWTLAGKTSQTYFQTAMVEAAAKAKAGLSSIIFSISRPIVAFWDGGEVQLLNCPSLTAYFRLSLADYINEMHVALLLPPLYHHWGATSVLLVADRTLFCFGNDPQIPFRQSKPLGWRPELVRGSTLHQPQIAYRQTADQELELLGTDEEGVLHRSIVQFRNGTLTDVTTFSWPAGACLAAAHVDSGLAVAVTPSFIQWLRLTGSGFEPKESFLVSLPNALACFPHYPTRELVVVCQEGSVVRMPLAR
jgi:tetratricopeptide (TPR) repeat protein